MSVSNLGPETSDAEAFHGFSQFLQKNTMMIPQIRPWPLLSPCFPIHYSLTTLPLTLIPGIYYEKSHVDEKFCI
jgi:hypothetical protein